MTRVDLLDVVECYRPGDRHNRTATWSEETPDGRWRPYSYDDIISRDKVSLFWLRDESLEGTVKLMKKSVMTRW